MNEFVFALGVLLVLITFLDAFATILWVDGSAGPITSRISTGIWKAFRAVFPGRHKGLSLAGPTILTVTLILWITLVWAGWVIAYTADPNALIYTRGRGTADLSGRIYFTAYTMFTVGNGDFHPNGSFWQIITFLVAMSGIIIVTISVSYILSVVPIVGKKRALVVLDDALTLLAFGVHEDVRPDPTTLKSARSAVRHFLKVLSAGAIGPAQEDPPPPNLQRLREASIPVVSDEEFQRAFHDLRDRRRLLLGMVGDATYQWPPRHLQ